MATEVKQPSWDQYFLKIAEVVATRSSCRRAQHGAVIVDKDNRILSCGYNGSPSNLVDCFETDCLIVDKPDYGPSCRRTIHAEMNAIFYLPPRQIQLAHKAYLTGFPCVTCAEYLLKFGIKEIICNKPYMNLTGQHYDLLDAFEAKIYCMDGNEKNEVKWDE